jgi:hypothetical protein
MTLQRDGRGRQTVPIAATTAQLRHPLRLGPGDALASSQIGETMPETLPRPSGGRPHGQNGPPR